MKDFNVFPYFDDFDPKQGYAKILFKDGFPIQTREFNNLQSIFQHKLKLFADHIFKNGSRVSGARFNDVTYDYVIINGISPWDNKPIKQSILTENISLRGTITKIPATLVRYDVIDDYHVLYVVYNGTAIDNETRTFVQGEDIEVLDENGNILYTLSIPCGDCEGKDKVNILGKGTIFVIEEGVFYFNGYFIENDTQSIIISPFVPINRNTENFDIGFEVIEEIITSEKDESLYDISLGYPNKSSPGADRYKIYLKLKKRDKNAKNTDKSKFITICSYVGGRKTFSKEESEYSTIMDFIAKRTYEESGNYSVKEPEIQFLEHKKKDENDAKGFDIDGSKDNFVIRIGPSISYVLGYRIENISDYYVIVPKARDTKKLSSYIHQFDELPYIKLKPKIGTSAYPGSVLSSKLYDNSKIELYDGPIDNPPQGTFLPTGTKIGTLKIYDLRLESGTPGSGEEIYRYYVYDIEFSEGKSFADVKSVFHPTNKFICEPVLEDGSVKVYNQNRGNGLVWKIKKNHVKSLRDIDNPIRGSLSFVKRSKLKGTLNSQGVITFTLKKGEIFVSPSIETTIGIVVTNGIPQTINLFASGIDISYTHNSLKINLGQDHAGKDFCIITNTMVIKSIETRKKISTNIDVIATLSETEKMFLTKSDVVKIIKITAIPKDPEKSKDIKTHLPIPQDIFEVYNGVSSSNYDNAYIRVKQGMKFPSPISNLLNEYKLSVEYQFFEHDRLKGFYTVDSYAGLIENGEMSYEDIPLFESKESKEKYHLSDCIDFRPLIINNEMINDPIFPAQNELAYFDLEYYLPRTDLLQVKSTGEFDIKLGISNDNPIPPEPDKDSMPIFEIWSNPYVYKLTDIRFKKIENKRYTMRDIRGLETRVKRIQYYTALNLLEKNVAEFNVKDGNGMDRFKNGFVIDNFRDFNTSSIGSIEFKCSFDLEKGELKPSFGARNQKLVFDPSNSSNYIIKNNILMLPYISVLADEQPYATKHISINPYFKFTKKGNLRLIPNVDTWSDIETLPEQSFNVDFGSQAIRGMTNALQRMFGNRVTNSSRSISSQNSNRQENTGNIISNIWSVANGTNTSLISGQNTQTQGTVIRENPRSGTKTQNIDLGERVTDISLDFWMREIDIRFEATNLSPDTKVYAFFDNVPVNAYCRSINGRFGEQLKTDSEGKITGIFRVPPKKFRTGNKKFVLTSDPKNSNDKDMAITYAETQFFAGGVNLTKQHQTLNVITPTFNFDERIEPPSPPPSLPPSSPTSTTLALRESPASSSSQSSQPRQQCDILFIDRRLEELRSTGVQTTTSFGDFSIPIIARDDSTLLGVIQNEIENMTNLTERCRTLLNLQISSKLNPDPVAQSFKFDKSCFITGIDIFFSSVDLNSDLIWVEIRTMENGYPTKIALTRKEFKPSEIPTSDNASVPLKVIFDNPIYVQANTEYCFVVGGASPNTRIWVARMGDTLIDNPSKVVDTQPTLGSSFRSQNGVTWNAEQFEDIKYRIYIAEFISDNLTAAFTIPPLTLISEEFETEEGSNKVRIKVKDHALKVNDVVKIYPFTKYEIKVNSNISPKIGETITTQTGSALIDDVIQLSTNNDWKIIIKNLNGKITSNQTFTTPTSNGTIQNGIPETLNGIPIEEIAKEHVVVDVDSKESFIIQTTSSAVRSGIVSNMSEIESNIEINLINVSGSYLKYDCEDSWSFRGIYYNLFNNDQMPADYSVSEDIPINTFENIPLKFPMKLVSRGNRSRTTSESVVKVSIKSPNKYISPVLNLDTAIITMVNNRISYYSPEMMNVVPNSVNRYVEETDPSKGSEMFKYTTKKINLSKPCSDLMILVDAYKDGLGDFDIYYRYLSPGDISDIDNHNWIKIPFKKIINTSKEKIEYEILLSELFQDWSTHDQIASFQVKIVGRTINTSNPPVFSNLRIIALT